MGFFDNLDLDDPKTQMLLQMGLGLLGGAPGQRKNFGADVAHAGLLGLQGYAGAKSQKAKMAQEAQQRELGGIQLQQARLGQQDDEAYRSASQGAPNFATPSAPNMTPTPESAAQLKRKSPYEQAQAMVEYLREKKVNEKHVKPYVEQMEKLRPKFKADQQLVRNPDGSLGMLNMAEDGQMHVVPYAPAEKQTEVNLGGQVGMVGQYSGKPGTFLNKSLSPDTAYQGGITMRGQNMTDSRSREGLTLQREAQRSQIIDNPQTGPLIVDKATGQARPVMQGGQPVLSESKAKEQRGAGDVLSLIQEAKKWVPKATGSFVGAGFDVAGRAIGQSPSGADAIARLKALEASLVAKMPRMEGPQSNYDAQLYREAVGQIGDPTIPNDMKMAALETVEGIQKRYAGGGVEDLLRKYLKK